MPELPPLFHRHDLLQLVPDKVCPACAADGAMIRTWLAAGWPVIVRRPGTDAAGIHCGIPLPPEQGKKRLAFTVGRDAVRACLPLPRLTACLNQLPEDRRRGLSGLRELDPEVFGSLAWQYLTGRPYVCANSDVDLLFRVSNLAALQRLLAQLNRLRLVPCDIEIMLWDGRAFAWRELSGASASILVKTDHAVTLQAKRLLIAPAPDVANIAAMALEALHEELATYPKPGLVSYVDNGSHPDMHAQHFRAAIATLPDYFLAVAAAGRHGATFEALRPLGIEAERRMLAATGGVNTHRGAIFSLGLLVAAAGYKIGSGCRDGLGAIVRNLWGRAIMAVRNEGSHGDQMARRYGAIGAKTEAAQGFRAVYTCGLPAFRAVTNRNAARIQCFFALLERVADSTLLYRGGAAGRDFAVAAAGAFNRAGGVNAPGWAGRALCLHREFVARNLSCGGVADLLAATIFVHHMEELCPD